MDFEPIGAVVGLKVEARIARRLGFRVAIGGGTAAGAEKAARALVRDGAKSLVSFGLCGGLQPPLRAGKLLIPRDILLIDGTRVATDPTLSALLGGATPHTVLGGEQIVADRREKKVLWQIHGAAAIDLESGAVARVATEHGLPCAALRVICDPASRALPPAAAVALERNGRIGVLAVLRSLLARPAQLRTLLGLAADAATARKALVRHVRKLRRAARSHPA